MFKKSSKGFTLVELLVVIAIIGILATLATVSLNKARSKARDAKRVSDLKQMSTAMELWNTDKNTYVGGCSATDTREAAGVVTNDTTAGCDNAEYITWVNVKSPQTPDTACAALGKVACGYTVRSTVAIDSYKFCTYFENANDALGLTAITYGAGDTQTNGACITQDGWVADL